MTDTGEYFKPVESCEKCGDAEPRHRYHFGYLQICKGVRFLRYWMLCTECLQNAKIKNENRQHPMWELKDQGKGKPSLLVLTDKTIWPENHRGRGYNGDLKHPSKSGAMGVE